MTTKIAIINDGNAGRMAAIMLANRRPATAPAAQLEIAAQWLHEAALRLTELKHMDMSMNLTRVGHDCEAMARRAS